MMATDQSLQTLAAQVQGLMLRCWLIWLLDTETVIFSLTPSLHTQQQRDCYMDAALCATDKGTCFSLRDLCFMTLFEKYVHLLSFLTWVELKMSSSFSM